MTQSPLHGARRKLERAEELLDEIQSDYDKDNAAALVARPRRTSYEPFVEPITGRKWFVVRLQADPPEDPPDKLDRWALLAGDAMHNTRSALDHLACRLIEHNGKKPNVRSAFPIWRSEPNDPGEQERYRSSFAGMSKPHRESIKKLQPYANPGTAESLKLLSLQSLDNRDKHRLLLPVHSPVGERDAKPPLIETDVPAPFDYIWNGGAILEQGVELLRFSPRAPIGEIRRFDLDVKQQLTYGDTSTSLRDLREIRSYVVGIAESFAVELG